MEAERVDLERFRLSTNGRGDTARTTTSGRLPKHRNGEKFLRGPIPWEWLIGAMTLGRTPLALALVIWRVAGVQRSRHIHLSAGEWACVGERKAVYRALDILERAGLITVERHRGRGPMIEIRDYPRHNSEPGEGRI